MNQDDSQQHVSTESQRLALEAMSAQLVHKLNAMIREQEERARKFAEQHHSTLPVPQPIQPTVSTCSQPEAPAAPAPPVSPVPSRAKVVPPPLTTRKEPRAGWKLDWQSDFEAEHPKEEKPLRIGPRKKTAPQKEESNIGMGMIIFSLVGIIMLLRSCT